MTDEKKIKYTVELPEDVIQKLEKYASDEGIKPDEVILDMLDTYYFPVKDQEAYVDMIFDEVVAEVVKQEVVSASFLQRKFAIGFNRARRILDQLEQMGYVEKADGFKPQRVIRKKPIS